MFLSPSHCRCGDRFMQQNSSERAPAPCPAPPKPHTPTDSFPTQIQYETHITETSYSSYFPASLNNHNQEEHTRSPPPPSPPNHQSVHDFHSSSSSYEPPDTDPVFTQALWSEVVYSSNTHMPPINLLDTSIVASSTGRIPPEEYDSQAFSSATFSEVLKRHQVTMREDVVVPWAWFRKAVEAAPAEVVSELEGCQVWKDSDEGTRVDSDAEDLAARLKALVMDRDSAQVDLQQFVADQILPRCALPGVRVYNNLKMLDVATEPYHLIPTTKSPTSSISTQPVAGKSARPISSINPSTNPSSVAPRRTALRNTVQPMKIDPPASGKLNLPRDMIDCAYWLEASELRPLVTWIARRTFVSSGTVRKTSPYLSIAFENSECQSFIEKKSLVQHKIAVYGSTALYNRRLLYINASKVGRNSRSSITQVERSACDLHFGLALIDEEATLYMFRCEEDTRGTEQDMVITWHGCSMSKVGEWILTAPNELTDMLHHLRIVADWARRVYLPILKDDLTQLFNSRGH